MKYILLWIDILIFAIPFALSFHKKITIYRHWKSLVSALIIPSFLMLIWDLIFVRLGIWKYNFTFFMGAHFRHLPLEVICFYVVIPYFILLIYELAAKIHTPKPAQYFGKILSFCISIFTAWLLYNHFNNIFVAVTALLLLFTLLNHLLVTKGNYLNHIFITWGISLLPFLVLDSYFFKLPLQIINTPYFSNLNLLGIPVERFCFNLLYLIWIIWVFERYRQGPAFKAARKAAKIAAKEAKLAKKKSV